MAVLLYDPERDAVVLTEQFRVGPFAAGHEPWLVEVVAGVIEPGETPEIVAAQETREETGLEPLDLRRIGGYYSSPGGATEHVTLFCARVDADAAGGLHGHRGEGEDIRVFALPRAEALAALAAGRILASPAVIALQWLALHHAALCHAWRAASLAGPEAAR